MSGTYLGSRSFGGAAVGVSADVTVLLDAVAALLAALDSLRASLQAAIAISATLEGAINLQLLSDIQIQLDAAIALGADLKTPDLNEFVAQLEVASSTLAANLLGAMPQAMLSVGASANLTLQAELEVKKLAIEALISLLGDITAGVRAALDVSIAALSLPPVSAAASLAIAAAFAAPSIHVARVSSPFNSVGAEAQSALAASGLAPGTPVEAVVLLVTSANTSGKAALDLAFVS